MARATHFFQLSPQVIVGATPLFHGSLSAGLQLSQAGLVLCDLGVVQHGMGRRDARATEFNTQSS
jgi:hypothetical protein